MATICPPAPKSTSMRCPPLDPSISRPSLRLNNLDVVLLLHGTCQTLGDTGTCRAGCSSMDLLAYLPLLQVVLLGLVLLDQVVEHLLQPLGVRLEGGDDILDGALHQHAVDQAEALAVARERLQCFENEPVLGATSDASEMSGETSHKLGRATGGAVCDDGCISRRERGEGSGGFCKNKKDRTPAEVRRGRGETRWWTGLLVLFGLLLDIANLLRNLLQRIFVSAVLQLEVCPGGRGEKVRREGTWRGVEEGFANLAASLRALLEPT